MGDFIADAKYTMRADFCAAAAAGAFFWVIGERGYIFEVFMLHYFPLLLNK